jgi:hypothetical protein
VQEARRGHRADRLRGGGRLRAGGPRACVADRREGRGAGRGRGRRGCLGALPHRHPVDLDARRRGVRDRRRADLRLGLQAGVFGTRSVSVPMLRSSRKNSTLPGDHSIVATCQSGQVRGGGAGLGRREAARGRRRRLRRRRGRRGRGGRGRPRRPAACRRRRSGRRPRPAATSWSGRRDGHLDRAGRRRAAAAAAGRPDPVAVGAAGLDAPVGVRTTGPPDPRDRPGAAVDAEGRRRAHRPAWRASARARTLRPHGPGSRNSIATPVHYPRPARPGSRVLDGMSRALGGLDRGARGPAIPDRHGR